VLHPPAEDASTNLREMRILVFDPSMSGHHSFYLRLLLPALLELSSDVTLVTSRNAPESREFQIQLREVVERVRVECVVPPLHGSLVKRGAVMHHNLKNAIERFRPDHVYVPAADHLSQVMSLRRRPARLVHGVEMEALMMRGGFAYPYRGWTQWVQDRLSLWAVERSPWTILHFVDPIPYETLQRRGGSMSRRLRLLPDPVETHAPQDRGAARRRLGVPETGRYLGSVGLMDERKGIDLLIRAFASIKLEPDDRLLLVGRASSAVQGLLAGPMAHLVREGRIIGIDRYVTNAEFSDAVSALDVVCTPYPQHVGSASIVIRAAAAERPVVSSTFGWVGTVVPRLGLGWSCDVSDVAALASTITTALERSARFRLSEAARRFVQYHSVENFQAAWTVRLRDRLELAPRTLHSWDWVLDVP
jgi:glycosyltransferase involved in cell wall biosynthesis